MNLTEPWSKKHKAMVKSASGGLSFSLSNSFAQPLTNPELIQFCKDNNGQSLVDDFMNHSLEYTPNGGSTDLKIEIAKLYDENITADNIMVFTGGQVALQTAGELAKRASLLEDEHFSPWISRNGCRWLHLLLN